MYAVKQETKEAGEEEAVAADAKPRDVSWLESSKRREVEALEGRPVATLQDVTRRAGLSFPAAGAGMELLVELGIARELTGKKRNRVFVYDRTLALLSEGTETTRRERDQGNRRRSTPAVPRERRRPTSPARPRSP